jgi:hypothetical protein
MDARPQRAAMLLGTVVLVAAFAIQGARATPESQAQPSAQDGPSAIPSAWQHHKAEFDYFGVTTLYTCDGLEGQVRRILEHLGARKDMHVQARGCPGPANAPSHTASVVADFYSLAPSTDASEANAVKAQWSTVELTGRRPNFMGDGDCELIDAMKTLISQNFRPRDLNYRTTCIPRELEIDGFAVKGEFLHAIPVKPG